MEQSQLVVFGAVALSLIVLLRRLRTLEATLADRTAALDAARSQPKAPLVVLSLASTYRAAPVPSLNEHSSRTCAAEPQRTCEAPPAPSEIIGTANLFETLPPETVERIFEALPAAAQLQCERVCSMWRLNVCPTLWPEWRRRQARLTETPLTLPGVPIPSYSSSPVDIPPAEAALAAEAHAAAAALPAEQLQLGVCGMGWTVIAPGSNHTHTHIHAHATCHMHCHAHATCHMHMHMRMHMHTHIHTCCTCACTCTRTYIHAAHAHMHMHMHTHIHAHEHAHEHEHDPR